jgi:hypothetical protein
MSATTYTLEEVAERTDRALEDVRNAVEKGNLALAQNASHERPRVTRVELERWKDMAEEHERHRRADRKAAARRACAGSRSGRREAGVSRTRRR